MLTFEAGEYFWTARARLPSWAGFQVRDGAYGAISSDAPSDGSVTIVFAPEGRDTRPLTAEEVGLVQWLLDNELDVARSLLDGLLVEYRRLQDVYGYTGDDRDTFMPVVSSPEGFRNLIGLHSVHVHPLTKDGLPYLGFEFGCTWDEEHGLGVLMHGTRLVQAGGADTAFLLWIARQDAEGA